MIETRKRVIKLKNKKKALQEKPTLKKKPPKSKFLELEADVGSASEDEDLEREIARPTKGNYLEY